MLKHRLTEDYTSRVARFAGLFPAAHAFLRRLETEGPSAGMWLSTAVNAHLYMRPAFLAYLKLKNPELKPPSLVISPKFNLRIAGGTRDESARLFPSPFDEVVAAHAGLAEKWAVRRVNGATELTVATPAAFFDDLYHALAALDVHSGSARRLS